MLVLTLPMSNRSLSEVAVEQQGFISAALISQQVSRFDRGLCWKPEMGMCRCGQPQLPSHSFNQHVRIPRSRPHELSWST